jgi:hypothetical protein
MSGAEHIYSIADNHAQTVQVCIDRLHELGANEQLKRLTGRLRKLAIRAHRHFTFDAPKIMVSSPSRLWEAAMYTALLTAIVTWIFHAGAREELAYAAQDKWLNLFGRNLSTLNVSTACP